MKAIRNLSCIMTVIAFIIGSAGMAAAFHGGGVAHCDGCHSMHNSTDNPIGTASTANTLLLKGSDASSTCFNCHAGSGSYHIASTTLDNTNAGGDFGWVKTDYTAIVEGNTVLIDARNLGHNIVAVDFGYAADLRSGNTQAPGGTYTSSLLGCTSCHDAHGQVHGGTRMGSAPISGSGSYGAPDPTDGSQLGNFRLLGDSDYAAGSAAVDNYAFSYDAPIAVTTNSTANNSSYGADTAYGSGMSEWCANCHDGFLNQTTKHPSGAGNGLLNGVGTNYSCYIKTGSWDCSQANTSYDELVPFERGLSVARTALSVTDTSAPGAGAQVMCLTCHRAHASANQNAGRWDLSVDMIAQSAVLTAIDLPGTERAYYDSTGEVFVVVRYGIYQRSLCNKCHVQD